MGVKVVIADDESVTRQGLLDFLESDPEIKVIGVAVNGIEVVQKAWKLKPDVILMDLKMPLMDGIEATLELKKGLPELKIIIMTGLVELKQITGALKAGANGYLLKTTEPQELCRVIKQVMDGVITFSPAIVEVLSENPGNNNTLLPATFSQREKEVIALVAQGKSNKEISYKLNLSEGTIKTHIGVILAKLNLNSRTQLALYAINVATD